MFEKITDWIASEECMQTLSYVGAAIGIIFLVISIVVQMT